MLIIYCNHVKNVYLLVKVASIKAIVYHVFLEICWMEIVCFIVQKTITKAQIFASNACFRALLVEVIHSAWHATILHYSVSF